MGLYFALVSGDLPSTGKYSGKTGKNQLGMWENIHAQCLVAAGQGFLKIPAKASLTKKIVQMHAQVKSMQISAVQ